MFRLLFPYSIFLLFGIINVDKLGLKINFIHSQIISVLQETQMSGIIEHNVGIHLPPLEVIFRLPFLAVMTSFDIIW